MPGWSPSLKNLLHPLQSRPLQVCLQLGLAAVLLWLWGRNLSWPHLARLIQPHEIGWLPAVIALALAGSVLRAWRWRLIVGRQSHLGIFRAFLINEGANLVNILIPARLGDLLRMFWLRRWCRLPTGGGAGMVMADHALELGVATVMLTVAAVAYLATHGASVAGLSLAADAGGALVLLTLLGASILFAPRLVMSAKLQSIVPAKMAAWLVEHGRHFAQAGPARLSPGRAAAGGALTFGAFGLDALMLSSLFASLGLSLPVLHSLAVCLALVPGYALPSPGGFGPVELIGTFAVQAGGGVAATAAAAGVLAFHLAGIVITL
ncbi:MAG TPA: lysylphosphatidylglycerol synthase transmembrane domain-containing protein, partial [Patescibacteria group bacterium]|nr:lysylphosphatidylglycerol synthase transmembrane domain-containing protein [Patescibacteria group bacterium]